MREASPTLIVIPCYREAERFSPEDFAALFDIDGLGLILVDDGSKDATPEVLQAFAATQPARAEVLSLPENRGKGEAVRAGMQRAIAMGAEVIGYLDADLATPVFELERLLDEMRAHQVDAVLASRVALLGADIRRSPARHYLGRIFATAASLTLQLRLYDSQCGAKLFRDGPAFRSAVGEPFLSRWAFDVELIGRLVVGAPGVPGLERDSFREVPLRQWTDAGGSKLGPGAMIRSAADLARIAADLRRRRRKLGGG
jgi:glycosyltransferase involved in cell wall biosynthesis